jgi:aminoglycoside phosphotransferase family enzyme/predicted kinase
MMSPDEPAPTPQDRPEPSEADPTRFDPAVIETHSGVVFFFGDRAYKAKKPVDLGFLDFRDRIARRDACRREVVLNRRLAPDVYLGVFDLCDSAGEPVEHVVVMRRMPPERRLAHLVEIGADLDAELDDLARMLAEFHAAAERGPDADRAATSAALGDRWAANSAELRPFVGRIFDGADVAEVDDLAARYLIGRGPLFDARIAAGRACDGHGDLLADDIFVLDDGARILDCLEFDDALRLGDGLADVAFLAMDLERLGRSDLAGTFLEAYRHHADDSWPASLVDHNLAYRAQVRAKVLAIRADQGDTDAARQARELLGLALDHLRAARVRLVLVGGLPGTGKSTIAAGVAETSGLELLRSDVIRKQLARLAPGLGATAGFGEGIYSPQATEATYDELLRRAEVGLSHGATVILDASWSVAARRSQARQVAQACAADVIELRCSAPVEVTAERMRARAEAGTDASDADEHIAAAMAAVADPWPEATELVTTGPVESTRRRATEIIDGTGPGSAIGTAGDSDRTR